MKNGIYWIIAGIIMMVIFTASTIDHLSLYDSRTLSHEWALWIKRHTIHLGTSGFFSYMLSPHPDFVLHKLGHIFAFGFLGMTLYMAAGRSIGWGIFIAAIFAVSDELHQYFVEGRSSRFWDIALDVFAAACFIHLLRLFLREKWNTCRLTGKGDNLKEPVLFESMVKSDQEK